MGDNPATPAEEGDFVTQAGGAPTAFMVSTTADCMDAPLTLLTATDDDEPTKHKINPTAEEEPTFAEEAVAGYADVSGAVGMRYLCVLVDKNEVPIPAVGDKVALDGYKISVTPKAGASGDSAAVAADKKAGSTNRNGTTVNITYLQTDPSYQQRLVIVNRGGTAARYWMEQFQHEAGVTVTGMIDGMIDGNSRVTVDVPNTFTITPATVGRTAGTLNLTAPSRSIDVMTVQQHLGTGQVDTTVYQNDEG